MLQLTGIKKFYNKHLVLEIPSIQLEAGIYWVKGPNGSGKTTLLKMVAGLLAFKGDILFTDISLVKNPRSYRQRIGWAEAEPLFPSFMSGRDLLSLYRNIRKVPRDKIEVLLGLFRMNEYIEDAIGTYSAGMTKKLSLLLAFLGDPPLIILDEPLITLDPESVNTVCYFIREKHKNAGTTFLMSSHQEPDIRLMVSGRELLLSNGTILME